MAKGTPKSHYSGLCIGGPLDGQYIVSKEFRFAEPIREFFPSPIFETQDATSQDLQRYLYQYWRLYRRAGREIGVFANPNAKIIEIMDMLVAGYGGIKQYHRE